MSRVEINFDGGYSRATYIDDSKEAVVAPKGDFKMQFNGRYGEFMREEYKNYPSEKYMFKEKMEYMTQMQLEEIKMKYGEYYAKESGDWIPTRTRVPKAEPKPVIEHDPFDDDIDTEEEMLYRSRLGVKM